MKNKFEIIVRAIILHEGKILLAQQKEENHYHFFPGGRVEMGEAIRDALGRELYEELHVEVKNVEFIGAGENIIGEGGRDGHGIEIVFKVELVSYDVEAQEDHMSFMWGELDNFEDEKILPQSLHKAVTKWIKDKKIFWASSNTQ